jgi:hypothetical protein
MGRFLLGAWLSVALGVAIATAQTYPSRPITFNVPFAAGGPVLERDPFRLNRIAGSRLNIETWPLRGPTDRCRFEGLAIDGQIGQADQPLGVMVRSVGRLHQVAAEIVIEGWQAACVGVAS